MKKVKVMMNKSLNVNKLLAREVHVDDSKLITWGARVVLRNLYMILYVPKIPWCEPNFYCSGS
jgi:hypothetical protein